MQQNWGKETEDSRKYEALRINVLFLNADKDVLCMSTEGNDNDYDAGGLGDF